MKWGSKDELELRQWTRASAAPGLGLDDAHVLQEKPADVIREPNMPLASSQGSAQPELLPARLLTHPNNTSQVTSNRLEPQQSHTLH